MMNTKIYKSVHSLAEKLMVAASKDDREAFDSLYAQLRVICLDNENTDKDHDDEDCNDCKEIMVLIKEFNSTEKNIIEGDVRKW